jgi:dTDP-4-amino-4,6-dideoxygalactose transaminase
MTIQPVQVPFVDLGSQHRELRPEIDAVIAQAIDSSSFIGGSLLTNFEKNFADYCGTTHAIGVSDGTHALILALQAVGVKAGDIVLTVSHTFIATIEAIIQCGAEPVFLEIDAQSYTLSPTALTQWLATNCQLDAQGVCRQTATGRCVAAVIPVHLYGLPAQMELILVTARHYNLKVVEDACQAHGAWYTFANGQRVQAGSMGDVGCFSFYPGKNLGAMGEGGAVTTHDSAVAQQVRILRDHGQNRKYIHQTRFGINARLDAIQAGVLDVKLKQLDRWNNRRREIAAYYDEALTHLPAIKTPLEPVYGHHVYHLYVILVDNRDLLQQKLAEQGVATGLHYPIPVHLQEAFVDQGYQRGYLPITEQVADTLLSLPMFPHMRDEQVEYVVQMFRQAL